MSRRWAMAREPGKLVPGPATHETRLSDVHEWWGGKLAASGILSVDDESFWQEGINFVLVYIARDLSNVVFIQ